MKTKVLYTWEKQKMEKKYSYSSTGLVYGYLWGGGEGAYPAETIEADTKEELLKVANEKLNDGSLDSGMGYESLIGATLEITVTEIITFEGKDYSHNELELVTIGDLNEDQIDFLYARLYN